MYSKDFGFYIIYYFEHGFWREMVLDDYIPIHSKKINQDFAPIFLKPVNCSIGPLLLEKAWAKKNEFYFHWNPKFKTKKKLKLLNRYKFLRRQAERIYKHLTGFDCERISVVNHSKGKPEEINNFHY